MRLIATALLLLIASSGWAQSLQEAAERERERRRQVGESQGYSQEDLDKLKPSPSPSPRGAKGRQASPAPSPTPSPAATPAPTPEPPLEEQRAAWRGRADAGRKAIAAADQRVVELEARIVELQADRASAPADTQDPNRLQNRDAALALARNDLDAARAAVARARQAFEELEEEARRSSVPPGWLRE